MSNPEPKQTPVAVELIFEGHHYPGAVRAYLSRDPRTLPAKTGLNRDGRVQAVLLLDEVAADDLRAALDDGLFPLFWVREETPKQPEELREAEAYGPFEEPGTDTVKDA